MMLQLLLKKACEDAGMASSYRNDYSGRGMFNRQCVGVTGTLAECMTFIGNAIIALRARLKTIQEGSSEEEQDRIFAQAVETLLSFEEDFMGRGMIAYWRHLEPLAPVDIET
jgi:hypothetical protein